METIASGARQAVKNCMRITPHDNVVIITDLSSIKISNYIKKESLSITPRVQDFVLEEFGKRPLKKLPSQIAKAISKATAVFYMATSQPGEKNSLRLPIVNIGVRNGKARQAHMPNITATLMKQGMNSDYKKIKQLSKKLYSIVKNAKEIKVTTSKGTNLTATFNPKWKWIISDGDIANSPTRWSNLPDGEVFTAPKEVNGIAVIDGCLGDYFIEKGKLKTPVIIEISKNRVKKISTADKPLEKELRKYIKQDKNSSRIGEFAIGTNIGLKRIVGNLLQDEKFPGVHIAMGDCYPNETLCPFPSKAHLDGVITKTNIFVDGKQIMKSGSFLI